MGCGRSLNWMQGLIVTAAVLGAAVGSAAGGAMGDAFGRKRALLAGDGLFVAGAVAMALAPGISVLVTGGMRHNEHRPNAHSQSCMPLLQITSHHGYIMPAFLSGKP